MPTDVGTVIKSLYNTGGKRFFEPQNQPHSPESDFYLCTELGRFNFVLKARDGDDGFIRLVKIEC
jgi:hypothetical protein